MVLALFISLFPSLVFAVPVPVTGAAGQVGQEVVTSRRVQISSFIDRWSLLPPEKRSALDAKEIGQWQIKGDGEEFKSQLSSLMLEMMVAAESGTFESAPKKAEDFRAAAEKAMKELGASPVWRKLEVERTEVEELLLVKERSKTFLKVKMESADTRIPEEDVRSYYNRQKSKLGGLAYEDIKGMIRERLTQEAQIDRLKDWFEILKRKYRVQYYGSAGK